MTRYARAREEWPDYDPAEPLDTLPLFSPVPIREMARRTDGPTSKAAAIRISDRLTEIQARVLRAYQQYGRMTARTCENLPEFQRADGEPEFAPSTIRKRISELADATRTKPWLRDTGEVESGCAIYEAAR